MKAIKNLIDTYIEVREELESYVKYIWDFIYISYSSSLDFGKDSTYYDFYVSKDMITIRYHNNCDYEPSDSDIDIPMAKILNGTWCEYIVDILNG